MEPSYVWSGWRSTWPTPNNVAWFLMGDFLRLSPWSGGLTHFVTHCESCAQDVENVFWWLAFGCCSFWDREKLYYRTCIFSLIVVTSLQLRGRRKIAEPRKYCLVRVIIFFGVCFLYFFVSYRLEFRVNSLQLVSEPRVRFEWEQWQRKQERRLE